MLVILIFILLIGTPALAQDNPWEARPIQHFKWGYIDKSGSFVIKPSFESATPFSEGVALVKDGVSPVFIDDSGKELFRVDTKGVVSIAPLPFKEGVSLIMSPDGQARFVDKSGKQIFDQPLRTAITFSEGLAPASPDGQNWGVLDKSGKFLIEPKFAQIRNFSNGLAAAMDKNLWGFIDRSGSFKIPAQFTSADTFSDGLAPVYKEGEGWYYIDTTGAKAIKGPFAGALRFSQGVAMVYLNETDKDGQLTVKYIDKSGKILGIDPPNTELYEGSSLPFTKDGKIGIGNEKGKIIVPAQYEWVTGYSEGLAGVKINGKWGFIDRSGNLAIPATFPAALPFSDGKSAVCIESK